MATAEMILKVGIEVDRPKHSSIGASSRARWSKCPGSVKKSEGLLNIAGPAAIEGTLAHEIIADILNKSFTTNRLCISLFNELVHHLEVYTDYVAKLKTHCKLIHLEHAFDMSELFPGLYGTADCVAYDETTRTLYVIDYKHGQGIVVEVENNKQLEYYALGALTTLKYRAIKVVMVIIQPRAYHPDGFIRVWEVPAIHFIDVEVDIVDEAKATQKKRAKVFAGSHCMFCLAKHDCNAYNKKGTKKGSKFYTDPTKDFKILDDEPEPFQKATVISQDLLEFL